MSVENAHERRVDADHLHEKLPDQEREQDRDLEQATVAETSAAMVLDDGQYLSGRELWFVCVGTLLAIFLMSLDQVSLIQTRSLLPPRCF